jgi:lipopolysaccharide biosynthesis regulator YciM
MERRKLTPNVTPNTLKSMIEYTLMSSILDRICEMTKKLLEYPRDDTKLNPFRHLLEIRTWEIEWKKVIDKIVEWLAWRWANAKIDKESIALMK